MRLDRNQKQSRAEERILERNTACPQGNVQPREGFGGGRDHIEEKGGQIMWKIGGQNFREETQNN